MNTYSAQHIQTVSTLLSKFHGFQLVSTFSGHSSSAATPIIPPIAQLQAQPSQVWSSHQTPWVQPNTLDTLLVSDLQKRCTLHPRSPLKANVTDWIGGSIHNPSTAHVLPRPCGSPSFSWGSESVPACESLLLHHGGMSSGSSCCSRCHGCRPTVGVLPTRRERMGRTRITRSCTRITPNTL